MLKGNGVKATPGGWRLVNFLDDSND